MKSENLYSQHKNVSICTQIIEDKELHNLAMDSNKNKTEVYDKWAESYDKYVEKEEYLGPRNVVSILEKQISDKFSDDSSSYDSKLDILDFGCGTGLVGKEIHHVFHNKFEFNLVGVDISSGMITESTKLGIYNTLVCDDIVDKNKTLSKVKEIVCNKERFDVIVACGVFLEGHVPLDAITRVLINLLNKNGGILALTIRDSFLNKSPNFMSELNNLKHKGFNTVELIEIDYLKGVKAWLLLISRN